MKIYIKALIPVCIAALLFTSCAPAAKSVMGKEEKNEYLFLVAGFDDAAENTDVIFSLGYNKGENSVKIAQIPRDTYYGFGKSQNKINQYYATLRSEGMTPDAAMKNTTDALSALFGASFDGFIGLTVTCFGQLVDCVGGVDINLSYDLDLSEEGESEPKVLTSGLNHIDGDAAQRFIRYRKGYLMGDLGRMDAQKLFLSAFLGKVASSLTLPVALKLISVLQGGAVTNLNLGQLVDIAMDSIKTPGGISYFFATVPGEPLIDTNGLSYYVLNRKSAAELASRYMFAKGEFDPRRMLLNSENLAFANIYEDDNQTYREYSSDTLGELNIKTS